MHEESSALKSFFYISNSPPTPMQFPNEQGKRIQLNSLISVQLLKSSVLLGAEEEKSGMGT